MLKKIVTPFRYPGAKVKFANQIFSSFRWKMQKETTYVEPFVGGGSVLCEFVNQNGVPFRVVLNDLDRAVSSFWKCLTKEEWVTALLDKITSTTPTLEEYARQKENLNSTDVVEAGFAALFVNRTSFSGMLVSGPIGGKTQSSKYPIGCRYNPKMLVSRVQGLYDVLHGVLEVRNEDFEQVMRQNDENRVLIYCDAPYYMSRTKMYRYEMKEKEHVRLRDCVRDLSKALVVLSYNSSQWMLDAYSPWAHVMALPVKYSISGKGRKTSRCDQEYVIINRPPSFC